MPNTCTQPGCGGEVVDGICQRCGTFIEESAAAAPGAPPSAPAAGIPAKSPSVKTARSTISVRSDIVSAHPSSLATVVGGKAGGARPPRQSHSVRVSTSRRLGAGLVAIEPLPDVEPLKLIRADLQIPESQRVCSNPQCGHALLGRDAQGKLLERGFCPSCRTRYSFAQIQPGTLISGQYEIKGPIAVGGCGFVYLGWDVNVGRYVVIKGLINSLDPAAVQAAMQERQFLANLRDPSIVDIVNFVTHEGASFIVMEFVTGVTLKTLRRERGTLPVHEAAAYILGILPAFTFLHEKRILYCDGKLDNFMLQGDRMRLIDMGGARRKDDTDADVYLTYGYSAPEAETAPSVTGDLYTVGRVLAVLIMDFDWQDQHRHSLPTPQEQPSFAQYESLYRFLLRATAADPSDRFQSAEEMHQQLIGVLREIVAVDTGTPRPAESALFTVSLQGDPRQADYRCLPFLKVDQTDPACGLVESTLGFDPEKQVHLLENAIAQYPKSMEVSLRIADACIDLGRYADAEKRLAELLSRDAYDWRIAWLRGRMLLAQEKPKEAYAYFDAIYSEIPGELAPKLALGLVSELLGDRDNALRFYDLVSRVDPGFTAAAFGYARCAAELDRAVAVEAYRRVPSVSINYTRAMMQRARTLIQPKPQPPGLDELVQASETVKSLAADDFEMHRLRADLLLAAIEQIELKRLKPDPSVRILDTTMKVPALRAAAEVELRQCAHYAHALDDKIALVDQANAVRPFTLT
jgi:serine/threonine-protein kinase PknG